MSFFKKSVKAEDIKEGGGDGKYISKSGVYDINIVVPFMGGTEKSPVVDLFIDYNDQKQPLYGNMRLTNNDGTKNFGADVFNKLLIIADIEDVADPVEAELPIGKKQANKDCAVLEDLADIACKVRVQMEYGIYNGNITEATIIKTFYREDGASAEEVVNGSEIGVQLAKDEPYINNVTYKDGLDEARVQEWITAKRPKGTAGAASTGAETKKPSFSKPKFGSKKD